MEFELKTARDTIQRDRASHAAEIERYEDIQFRGVLSVHIG